jgi:signal peptidase I
MAVGSLLRGLVPPAAWLPCHELFASWHHWLPSSLPRLRPPASDGFKLLLVLLLFSAALAEVRYIASSSMAPTLRPGDRAVAEKVAPPLISSFICDAYRITTLVPLY